MRRAAALLACALAGLGWPSAAGASADAEAGSEATAAQVRDLADAAQRDPAALERLRAIETVDGRSVRLGPALRGSPAEVRARLRALSEAGSGPATATPTAAREQARDVLAARRFQPSSIPTPLRSFRERLGEALRPLGKPFEKAFEWVADRLPGGRSTLWLLLAVAALAATAALAARAAARRGTAAGERAGEAGGEERPSAARLREQADRAERGGDLDTALRLRFRAGLVELDSRDLIELRPALTNRELLRELPSPTLEGLVDGFEAVAYGGRPAHERDVSGAREGWPRVVEEAEAR